LGRQVSGAGFQAETANEAADRFTNKRWHTKLMAEKIRALRQFRGLTQKQLAEQMNVSETAVRNYEIRKASPKGGNIDKMAMALGVRPECLRLYDLGAGDAITANSLFQMAEVYGLEPRTALGYVYLQPTTAFMRSFFGDWSERYESLKSDELNQTDYQLWKDCYATEYNPSDFPERYSPDVSEAFELVEPWEAHCFAAKTKALRASKDMTQPEFAELLGVRLTVYRSYEQGRNLPKVSVVEGIAARLGITSASLVFFDFGSPVQAAHALFQVAGEFGLRPDVVGGSPILRTQLGTLERIIVHWDEAFSAFCESGDGYAYECWKDHYDPEAFGYRVLEHTRYPLDPDEQKSGFSDCNPYDPKYPYGFLKA